MAITDIDKIGASDGSNRSPGQRSPGLASTPAASPAGAEQAVDELRAAAIASTMRAFRGHREAYVRSLFSSEQSPPDITYALGEAIYAFFRHRQLVLNSRELRDLTATIIQEWAASGPSAATEQKDVAPAPADQKSATPAAIPVVAGTPKPMATEAVIATGSEPAKLKPPAMPGTQTAAPANAEHLRVVHDAALHGAAQSAAPGAVAGGLVQARRQPQNDQEGVKPEKTEADVVTAAGDAASVEALAARCIEAVEARIAARKVSGDRSSVLAAIDGALSEVLKGLPQPASPKLREQLFGLTANEVIGLGAIARIWRDSSVQSIFVNGANNILVERNGSLVPATTSFRDEPHLLKFIRRIGVSTDQPVSELGLPNGGKCVAIFPPVSPEGPVFAFHRGATFNATLASLIASDTIDERIAALLRLAAKAGLATAVIGPRQSAKTSILSAICNDLGETMRIVTVARSRELRARQAGRIELVESENTPLATLLHYAGLMGPELLVIDGAEAREAAALVKLDRSGIKGLMLSLNDGDDIDVAALGPDIVIRTGWGYDSQLRVLKVQDSTGAPIFTHEAGCFRLSNARPAFAEKLQAADHTAALARVLS
jgi:type IV secretory pathway ATPase VirB11/archaellum biosynthesis ATPase